MPTHDWTKVDAGIFHDFHQSWITEIKRALNQGRLPPDYYALAEQIAGGLGPDVLTLQSPTRDAHRLEDPTCAVALAEHPPQVQFHLRAEGDWHAAKANAVVIRHVSDHRVISILEIVSPGNKSSVHGLHAFVNKAVEMLQSGIHLLVVDVFPPGPRDPQGIHKAIWDEVADNPFALPANQRLTLAAYAARAWPEAFVEAVAVGDRLPDMPLFLSGDFYVPVPLEAAYQSAWTIFPAFWRDMLENPG
ncbi:MAG TPA: DUF4058 family protein [Pirellulales bacterium]|nr:DUF4058 family protein [Pirellulales bacterium]